MSLTCSIFSYHILIFHSKCTCRENKYKSSYLLLGIFSNILFCEDCHFICKTGAPPPLPLPKHFQPLISSEVNSACNAGSMELYTPSLTLSLRSPHVKHCPHPLPSQYGQKYLPDSIPASTFLMSGSGQAAYRLLLEYIPSLGWISVRSPVRVPAPQVFY